MFDQVEVEIMKGLLEEEIAPNHEAQEATQACTGNIPFRDPNLLNNAANPCFPNLVAFSQRSSDICYTNNVHRSHYDHLQWNAVTYPVSRVLSSPIAIANVRHVRELGGSMKRKFEKGRPKQPLSAYNIFFRDERRRLIRESHPTNQIVAMPELSESAVKRPDCGNVESNSSGSSGEHDIPKQRRGRPRGPNYRKRKPKHGRISFQNLAKTIASNWKLISPDTLAIYKQRAKEDRKRYELELDIFRCKQIKIDTSVTEEV